MDSVLPLKAINDGVLFSTLKEGRLKGPNAAAYDAKAWVGAAAESLHLTERDLELLYTALFLGVEFESLRSYMAGKLPKLAPTDAVDFVVAGTNLQTISLLSRTEAKFRKRSRVSEIGYMGDAGDIRIRNSGHQDLYPDDVMAVLVDSMANLLFRVSDAGRVPSQVDRGHALGKAHALSAYASIEHGLKDIWNRAVWDGCTIRSEENCHFFTVGDEAFAKFWLAWRRRFETLILQVVRLQAGEAIVRDDRRPRTPILMRTVVGIDDGYGRKRDYIIGKARRGGEQQASAIGAIESCYLAPFLDEILPNYQKVGLTYRDLWRAWWVLQDIALVHRERMPKRGLVTWDNIRSYALRFSVSRVTEAIANALGLSLPAAEVVIEIFSADPDLLDGKNASDLFQRGTWGRPILRLQREGHGRILLASLLSPNPVLTMERWMMRSGMMEDQKNYRKKTVRGKVFENIVRERFRISGAKNRHLTGFCVSYLASRGESTEEIDALVCFGSTIIVCEVKCFNIPFEPIDRYNHLRKVEEAVEQVNRKTDWAQRNLAMIFDALSISETDRGRSWRFVPIVVLNSAFGAGLTLDGCAVTDVDWMSTFLGSPDISVSGAFERGRGAVFQSRKVYRDQSDLEQRFTEVAASPPSLAFELGRIEWETVPFPTRSGRHLLLQVPVSKGMPNMVSVG